MKKRGCFCSQFSTGVRVRVGLFSCRSQILCVVWGSLRYTQTACATVPPVSLALCTYMGTFSYVQQCTVVPCSYIYIYLMRFVFHLLLTSCICFFSKPDDRAALLHRASTTSSTRGKGPGPTDGSPSAFCLRLRQQQQQQQSRYQYHRSLQPAASAYCILFRMFLGIGVCPFVG